MGHWAEGETLFGLMVPGARALKEGCLGSKGGRLDLEGEGGGKRLSCCQRILARTYRFALPVDP